MADAGGSVALVRGGALGDFILTLPLIRALRDNFPRSRLVLVGDPSTTRLGGAAELVSAEAGDWARMYTQDGPPPTLADQFADSATILGTYADSDTASVTSTFASTDAAAYR